MPSGIGELTRLQRLSIFAVGDDPAGCSIGDLNELVNLKGHLHITGLNNLDAAQASTANLWNKLGIQKLTLEWSELTNFNKSLYDLQGKAVSCISDSQHPRIGATAEQVLKCLKPHSNLEELSIKGYNGSFSPSWLGWLPLDRLASIELKDCHNCKEVPSLGCLPSLKHILIQLLPSVKLIGPEFFGNVGDTTSNNRSRICNVFPSLESLKFRNMEAWEEWLGVKSEHFPNLKYFSITRCSKLKLLPKFNSEPKLKIQNCDLLQMPLSQKYWNTVKHISAQNEISYTCIAEGGTLFPEASCSYRLQCIEPVVIDLLNQGVCRGCHQCNPELIGLFPPCMTPL